MKESPWNALFAKDTKSKQAKIFLVFCVGLFLFMANQLFSSSTQTVSQEELPLTQSTQQMQTEAALEERLEAVFSQVAGAGKVEVMVYFQTDGELVVAEEESSQTRGEDTERSTQTVLMETGSGRQEPLVVQQKAPQVEGVLIVAQGGNDARVQQALIAGAQALLGVPAHKIAVFPMETAR